MDKSNHGQVKFKKRLHAYFFLANGHMTYAMPLNVMHFNALFLISKRILKK